MKAGKFKIIRKTVSLSRSCGSNCLSWNIENFCLRVSFRAVTISCILKLLIFISSGADEMMNFPSASTFLLYFSLLLHCMFNWITCKIVLCASNCIYKTEVVCGLNCFRWRDNPMLPRGLLYEGVSNEPILLSGGSAAQSSTIQCFDALLCIQHEDETGKNAFPFWPHQMLLMNESLFVQSVDCSDRKCFQKQLLFSFFQSLVSVLFIDSAYLGSFLTRMREYMPPAHRQLIETLSVCPSLRDFILSHSSSDLCQAYKSCVSALVDLRNYHLNTVAKYVVVPGNHARAMGCPLRGVGTALNETGTGGSSLMVFLKSVRNTTQKALILERPSASKETEMW